MVRVAHITTAHTSYDIRIFYKECVSLTRQGFKTYLIAPCKVDEQVNGVNVVALPTVKHRLKRMAVLTWSALKAARKIRAAVYHIHDPELLFVGQLLRMTGARVIFDMHENTPKSILTKPWLPRCIRKPVSCVFRLIERVLLQGLWVVFAEESYVKDYKWVSRYAVVMNMPIIEHLLDLSLQQDSSPTLGYLGAVTSGRGSEKTLEVIRLLKSRGCEVHWLCVGRTSDTHKAQLLSYAEENGISDLVELHGHVPPEEGWKLMTRCHIGLALLRPEPNYVEAFPTKMFEYMALGLPVIVSNFPLYQEIVERCECGTCVDPLDAEKIADAVQRILSEPGLSQRMGTAGKKAVIERFNWKIEEKKLLDLYGSILRQEPGGLN